MIKCKNKKHTTKRSLSLNMFKLKEEENKIMKKEEITLKNTKAEILDALNEALEREKNMAQLKYEPEKEEKKQKVEKAIEETRENVEKKIFSEELNKKFLDLEMAIQEEERKLKELYGIEKELNNLVVIVNTGKDYMAELDNTKKRKIDEISEETKKLEEEYRIKKEELEKEYETKAKNLKTERERENEEYSYKIKREREISNNKWEDEKAAREKELTKKETEIETLHAEAEAKAEHIKELESKVNEMPIKLENEYIRGKREATAEIEKENKYTIELLKKDYESTIERQKDKIETLKEEVEKINSEKVLMQEKLDQAYNQIKEMATKTVEAAGGVKILGNNGNDAKM